MYTVLRLTRREEPVLERVLHTPIRGKDGLVLREDDAKTGVQQKQGSAHHAPNVVPASGQSSPPSILSRLLKPCKNQTGASGRWHAASTQRKNYLHRKEKATRYLEEERATGLPRRVYAKKKLYAEAFIWGWPSSPHGSPPSCLPMSMCRAS